jgi:hypothetical protein
MIPSRLLDVYRGYALEFTSSNAHPVPLPFHLLKDGKGRCEITDAGRQLLHLIFNQERLRSTAMTLTHCTLHRLAL